MPTVDGKKFAYTPEGLREAAEAKRSKPGYNFTKNLGGPADVGYTDPMRSRGRRIRNKGGEVT